MMHIGPAIREERLRREWSIAKLARKTELDGGYISRLERAKVPSPSLETIRRIAEALELSVDELMQKAQVGEDVPLSPAGEAIVAVIRRLRPERQQEALRYLRFLADEQRQWEEEERHPETSESEVA